MKKIIFALVALASSSAAQPNVDYVSTYGPWPLCVNGALAGVPGMLAGDCSWYAPGSETYSLNIHADSPATDSFAYKVTVILQDGSTKTLEGVAARADDKTTGYTKIINLAFGGIIKSVVSIDVKEKVSTLEHHLSGPSLPRMGAARR